MREPRDRDLFPWILGAVVLAAGAFGVVLATAPASPPPHPMTSAPAPIAFARPPAEPRTTAAAPAAAAAPLPTPAVALASAQIWQCEIHGQRVFADSPCGAGASLREVGEVNRMNPTPVLPQARYTNFEPPYAEPPVDEIQSTPAPTVYAIRPVYLYSAPRQPRPAHPRQPPSHGSIGRRM